MSNFSFLQKCNPLLHKIGVSAEKNFSADPNTTLMKMRQLGEAIAQDVAANTGVDFDEQTTQNDLLYYLNRELRLERSVMNLFHVLRKEGNRASHEFHTQHKDAMNGLKVGRSLALWYYRSFGDAPQGFKPGAFVAPTDPSAQLRELQAKITHLAAELREANQEVDTNKELATLKEKEREEFEVLATQMEAEAQQVRDDLQATYEAELAEQKKQNKLLQKALEQAKADTATTKKVREKSQKAAKEVVLSEEMTRIIIDLKLNELGWEADTQDLTYSKGARPEKGKNKAIAEWPTIGRQSADYVLFVGLTPVAVVEAKKENVDVAGKITQAERYARGFKMDESFIPAWQQSGYSSPWSDGNGESFQIPFVYSCNGRDYVKQLAEKSGTWFRDLRSPSNIKRPLQDFHSPEGLIDMLRRDKDESKEQLKKEGFSYLRLRDYQVKAIKAVENAIADDKRRALLAMATGTGKTRTVIGLIYRLLKAERYNRILFLVDRTSLGDQALDSFKEAPLEQSQPLSKIYNVAELGDMTAEAETRVQVATVQAMVHRLFISEDSMPIDAYDCIIVDEAHRGYTLDQEMTEGELLIRDNAQYLSSYRRVLDYFDAMIVGLTATPAKHTTEIFGKPVYTYSYREAVADDWLIDHEPPIRYETLLTQNGITFEKGEVSVVNSRTGEVETTELEDELNFEVESFNKRVITEGFNRVICEQLAQEIDPTGEEKTMIFCATDIHADMVKRLLDETFKKHWGDDYNEKAVRKITGKSDRVKTLIKEFKNERYPSIAITVDLLTTGIDVPAICHLVFMRRVRSRILYEQMIGRATRRCDDIGKTVFYIYDPVDIYATLEEVNTMKPLVKNPNVPLEQLLEELRTPESYDAPGEVENSSHAHDVLAAVTQKVMRVLRKAEKDAENKPQLREKLDELEQLWGIKPTELHHTLHELDPKQAIAFIDENTSLVEQLQEIRIIAGSNNYPVISEHKDELVLREQSYGVYGKPEDYLESFEDFIKRQVNESIALSVVVNRPKDLTREQLKEVRMLLDSNGFSEAKLKSAWRNSTNHEIAASIVGYIRRAAIGEELIPFEKRVDRALEKILTAQPWNPVQKKWLNRIGKQLTHEVVIDNNFMNSNFARDGGVARIDTFLNNKLDTILETLQETLWTDVSA